MQGLVIACGHTAQKDEQQTRRRLRAQTQGLALQLLSMYNAITYHSLCHQQASSVQARNRESAEKQAFLSAQ